MEKKQEKKTTTIYNKLQDRLTARVNPLFHGVKAELIYDQLAGGQNKYLKLERIENTIYDPRWLDNIESCIPSISSIVKNPKKVIENVAEVVPIELARKTNADSVKHLATHSQYVKELDDNGEVIPNKILNIRSDDFYQTYENRFIATLIRRLVLFVEKRYQIIINNVKVQRTEILMMKNKSVIDGKEVEIETKVKVASEIELSEEQTKFNTSFIQRIEEVRKYLLYFYNSDFMKMLKTEKNVRNPIIMTNIIRKNVLYNNCYRLYKFIEKFDNIGVEFKVEDKYEILNDAQQAELNNALMTSFLALRGHETTAEEKVKLKKFKPRVITTIDDEAFIYGDFVNGPIELLRCDDAHMKYLDSQINKDVPDHPTKKEKEYYAEEIERNKEIKLEKKRIEQLLKEKQKQAEKLEKQFAQVIEQRKKEEELELQRLKKAEEQARLDEIEKARLALIGNPELYKGDETEELKPVEEHIEEITIYQPSEEDNFGIEPNNEVEETVEDDEIEPTIEISNQAEEIEEAEPIKETTENEAEEKPVLVITESEESDEEAEELLREPLDDVRVIIKQIETALKPEEKAASQKSAAVITEPKQNDKTPAEENIVVPDEMVNNSLDNVEDVVKQIEEALKPQQKRTQKIVYKKTVPIDDLLDEPLDNVEDIIKQIEEAFKAESDNKENRN